MMSVLRSYEHVSRQLINKSKSLFYLHDNVHLIFTIRLRKLALGKVNSQSLIWAIMFTMVGKRMHILKTPLENYLEGSWPGRINS